MQLGIAQQRNGVKPVTTTIPPMPAPNGCLNRRDAASYLSISIRLLDKLATAGKIPRVKIGAKTIFRRGDLDAFIDSKIQRLPTNN